MATNICKTPVKENMSSVHTIKIPATPFLKKIGYGTGVAVYELTRSPYLNKFRSPWAVKKLVKKVNRDNTEYRKRLIVESEVLRQLQHPNVVGFRGLWSDTDGEPCLAMEECDSSLGDVIEERLETVSEPFPVDKLHKVGWDISNALNYLHNEVLLIHCDIKSYNILIKGNFDNCKLCDFGVSLPIDKDGNVEVKTGKNVEYIGTPAWSAPEVLKYPQIITTKTDIYAFGLVFWEMLALMPPIDEDTFNTSIDLDESDIDDTCMVYKKDRKRPPLPEFEFNVEYEPILNIYNLCTYEDLHARPTAYHLKLCFDELVNKG